MWKVKTASPGGSVSVGEPLYPCVSTNALSQGAAQACAAHTTGSESQPYQHSTIYVSLASLLQRCSFIALCLRFHHKLLFYAELLFFCLPPSLRLSFLLSVWGGSCGPGGCDTVGLLSLGCGDVAPPKGVNSFTLLSRFLRLLIRGAEVSSHTWQK